VGSEQAFIQEEILIPLKADFSLGERDSYPDSV